MRRIQLFSPQFTDEMLSMASFQLLLDYSTYASGNYKWPGTGTTVPTEKLAYPQGKMSNLSALFLFHATGLANQI